MTHTSHIRSTAYVLTAFAVLAGTASPAVAAPATPSAPAASAAHRHDATGIPFTAAEVTAREDGSYRITWQAPGVRHVTVRANGRTVAGGGSTGSVTVTGLPAADRQWFDLVPSQGGRLRLADRLIRLDGTVNFRDAGGYRTADGHWVKMGVVHRSDSLERLTDTDLAKLTRLGISVDYDLRTTSERTTAPDRLPDGVRYVVADVMGDTAGGVEGFEMPTTPEQAEQFMIDGEKGMVGNESARTAYTAVLNGITADADGSLYHCTAGKDRTGWASAVLLTALGVPRETVMRDYLASNHYRAEANAAALAALPPQQAAVYKPLLDVRPSYLNSGFEEVEDAYGSFTRYERQALGLDAKDLRKLRSQLLVG
ncbi:tyrosine-protein phosphatase [Streptomyces abyssomicinicus]|uniref:tyrosine-protein phosphatase n=1 Tax=Streptomyces abyssomicinicus TaxID=574929 RepID=UPI00125004DA|nr:tyrosine-protein phosphatase [Streptomyces abyssomicinicus]